MSNFKIPLSYNPVDSDLLKNVLDSYQGKNHTEIVSDFEEQLKVRTGAPFALALNSGTSAIHLALRLLEVGPGDEVIASTFTYVATVNPVLYQGATPVFIDSERSSWNMDPDLLETALKEGVKKGKKPKAIIVVHCYGMPARMEEIIKISQKYEVPVIEDAAEALGSTINGRHVGTFGDLGILSFNNNKIVTTYGGGALLSVSENYHKKALFWSSQSRENFLYYLHHETGFNYRMGPLNAACGRFQLKDLENRINSRRKAFSLYREALLTTPVKFSEEPHGYFSNRWITTVLLKDQKTKQRVTADLLGKGIEIRPLWNPMHKQPLFKGRKAYLNGVSEGLFSKGLCLPSNNNLEEIDEVLRYLRSCLK